MKRAPSPAPSENEVDILDSLFTEDVELAEEERGRSRKKAKTTHPTADLDFGDLLNTPGGDGGVSGGVSGGGPGSDDGGGDGDGDEAFIASLQRSSNRKSSNLQGKTVKKGGGFQAMGLDARLLRAITRKGFSVPTPIQRKAIPLVLEGRDVVGMARTGSGKTAAFVIPMIERLRAHSARVGARALVLSPSRELALQTLKVVKEFGRGTDLKSALLVGGDSLEEQFGLMASNPDIVIATPGRFLHLKVEMSLNLSSVKYVVFDEADRLFEMGFAAQLTEILHALPPSRQTLLFSATLPSSLVDFARAGLQDPSLVRLDAETKVSPDLESAFLSVKGPEKEGALLHILLDVIKMPVGLPEGVSNDDEYEQPNKRGRGPDRSKATERPTEHSTIIFTATKHHVEYLATLLKHAGFAVSYVYGALDQTARRIQVEDFRRGRSNILVVTDVAARGIDIPVLANVINYDFPPQPKVFVHRVGRTARAGQRGRAYALVRESDAPYLLDLQLFLGRKLVVGQEEGAGDSSAFARDIVVGALQRSELEAQVEWVGRVLDDSEDMDALRRVAAKAEKLYLRTRNSASTQSAKRAREMVSSQGWMQLHPLFGEDAGAAEQIRADLLSRISNFKPAETIFEIGVVGMGGTGGGNQKARRVNRAAEVARNLRSRFCSKRKGPSAPAAAAHEYQPEADTVSAGEKEDKLDESSDDVEAAVDEPSDEEELEVIVSGSNKTKGQQSSFQDPEIFMTYMPRATNMAVERGLGVHTGSSSTNSNFVEAARDAAMDLVNDEGAKAFGAPARARLRWDKKQSKYVARANDEDGSRGAGRGRMIVGESGVKIAASFQSGRFDKWRRANRLGRLPRVGDAEQSFRTLASAPRGSGSGAAPGGDVGGGSGRGRGGGADAARGGGGGGGRRFKHKAEKAPKEADKYRDDFHVRKRRVAEAREKRVGRFRDGEGSRRELKSAVEIRKARELREKKKAKNARPSRSGKGRKGR